MSGSGMSFSWVLLLKGLPESELRQADVPDGLYVVPIEGWGIECTRGRTWVGGHGYLVFIRADHAGALKGLYNFYLPTIFIPFVDQRRDALIQGGYRAVHKRVPQEFKRRWRNESARLCGARQCPWQKVMPK